MKKIKKIHIGWGVAVGAFVFRPLLTLLALVVIFGLYNLLRKKDNLN